MSLIYICMYNICLGLLIFVSSDLNKKSSHPVCVSQLCGIPLKSPRCSLNIHTQNSWCSSFQPMRIPFWGRSGRRCHPHSGLVRGGNPGIWRLSNSGWAQAIKWIFCCKDLLLPSGGDKGRKIELSMVFARASKSECFQLPFCWFHVFSSLQKKRSNVCLYPICFPNKLLFLPFQYLAFCQIKGRTKHP